MERPGRTRVAILVGATVMAMGVAGCADDGNAGNINIVSDIDVAPTAPTSATSKTGDNAVERFEVEIVSFQFGPADAVVPAGTEVVWLNNDTDVHSIISTGDGFASGEPFEPGETYAVTFSEPGVYEYTCGIHPFMHGTITVQ